MLRFTLTTLVCLTLTACGQNADAVAQLGDHAKAKLTAVGEGVQDAQKRVAEALPDIQDTLEDTSDKAKSALTAVGNTTVAVGQATSQTLTAVGTTVMEATGKPVPAPAATPSEQR